MRSRGNIGNNARNVLGNNSICRLHTVRAGDVGGNGARRISHNGEDVREGEWAHNGFNVGKGFSDAVRTSTKRLLVPSGRAFHTKHSLFQANNLPHSWVILFHQSRNGWRKIGRESRSGQICGAPSGDVCHDRRNGCVTASRCSTEGGQPIVNWRDDGLIGASSNNRN